MSFGSGYYGSEEVVRVMCDGGLFSFAVTGHLINHSTLIWGWRAGPAGEKNYYCKQSAALHGCE